MARAEPLNFTSGAICLMLPSSPSRFGPPPILEYSDGALEVRVVFRSPPCLAFLDAVRFRALSGPPRQLRLAESILGEGRVAGSTRTSDVWAVPRREP
eukprot:5819968-Pyramimonas_sp.AAC.1